MSRMVAFALLILGVVAVAQAQTVPSLERCEIAAMGMDAGDFVARALGGSTSCVTADDKSACCEQILGLFGEGGPAQFCMCNRDVFSTIMMGLPGRTGVDPTGYVELLEVCGVPVAGAAGCPGDQGDVEPIVQGQGVIKKAVLLKKVVKKGAALKALSKKKKPAPAPKDVKPASTKSTPPPPPPPPPPAKKGAAVLVVPAKKAPAVTVVEPAPAPAPVAPKVTAPAVAPKVTAGRKFL